MNVHSSGRSRARARTYRPDVESVENRQLLSGMVNPLQGLPCVFDMVVVMDGSGSISSSDFQLQKDFVGELVQEFTISNTFARISVVQFSSEGSGVVEIGLSGDETAILNTVAGIVQIDGSTDIQEGLALGQGEIVANGRVGVPKVIALLTDGEHNEGGDPVAEADSIKAAGTSIFAIGVGSGINQQQLEDIASDPSSTYVSIVQDFDDLQALVASLAQTICQVTGQLSLDPVTAVNPIFTSHTVTASLRDLGGNALAGVPVTFQIVAGPNAGISDGGVTDNNGELSFTYTSNGQLGTDTIVATANIGDNGDSQVLSSTATKEWEGPTEGPIVTRLGRIGYHHQPTTLVVSFDRAMDEVRAEEITNYIIVDPGRDGRLQTRDDQLIPLQWADYDATSWSVALRPTKSLSLHRRYGLIVNGTPTGGLTDTFGVYLGGQGAAFPGTNYETVFGKEIWIKPVHQPIRPTPRPIMPLIPSGTPLVSQPVGVVETPAITTSPLQRFLARRLGR